MTSAEVCRAKRGRPRDEKARLAILGAALELVLERGFSGVTVESIAAKAQVSRPTIYRWWPDRAAVVMDAFFEAIGPEVDFPDHEQRLESIRLQMLAMARMFRGRFGTLIKALLGQAQMDPALAKAFRERWTEPRRANGRRALQAAQKTGEISAELDIDVTIDGIWGGMYYRLLIGHGPLSESYINQLFHFHVQGLRR